METQKQSTKKSKPFAFNLTDASSHLPKKVKVKSKDEVENNLFQIEWAISKVKGDLSEINSEIVNEHKKVLNETLGNLFKKRKDLLKDL